MEKAPMREFFRAMYEAECVRVFKDVAQDKEHTLVDNDLLSYADCYRAQSYDKYDLSGADATGENFS